MEHLLRAALLDWLSTGGAPLDRLNIVSEELPLRASIPWLGIATSASADWSTKDRQGREIRIALELHSRADMADADEETASAIEQRTQSLPAQQSGFRIINAQFLRARIQRRDRNIRSTLIEYRFRCLAAAPA